MYDYRNSHDDNKNAIGKGGFVFLLFIVLSNMYSLWWLMVIIIVIAIAVGLIKRGLTSTVSSGLTGGLTQPRQDYQPYYQPYQQGYQAPQNSYSEGGQPYRYPGVTEYDQYEQPQAQYPEEMPPMQKI